MESSGWRLNTPRAQIDGQTMVIPCIWSMACTVKIVTFILAKVPI